MNKCPYCGSSISDNADECAHCTAKIHSVPTPISLKKQKKQQQLKSGLKGLIFVTIALFAINLLFSGFFSDMEIWSDSSKPISPILTTSELDQIVPYYWGEGYGYDKDDLWWKACENDCYLGVWGTENSSLLIIVSNEQNSTIAEDVVQNSIRRAKDYGATAIELEKIDYMPDHTWFGFSLSGPDDFYTYHLFSQDQKYYVEVQFLSLIYPDEERQTLLTNVVFLIAGEQWKKLYELGEIENISFVP
jgi:hypothetical protein